MPPPSVGAMHGIVHSQSLAATRRRQAKSRQGEARTVRGEYEHYLIMYFPSVGVYDGCPVPDTRVFHRLCHIGLYLTRGVRDISIQLCRQVVFRRIVGMRHSAFITFSANNRGMWTHHCAFITYSANIRGTRTHHCASLH